MANLNYKFLEFMNQKYNSYVEEHFTKEKYPKLNRLINNNFFATDEYGIPIRMKEENKKTLYGWKRIDGKFYHYLTDISLIDILTEEETRKRTINSIVVKHKGGFNKSSTMKKFLTEHYPEIMEEF